MDEIIPQGYFKCTECHEIKEEYEFRKRGIKNGIQEWRKKCKICENEIAERNKLKKLGFIKDNIILTEKENKNMQFTENEVEILKNFCQILKNLNIENCTNKSNRKKVTFNVDEGLQKAINEFSNKTLFTKSDVVNMAIESFLNRKGNNSGK